MRYNRLEAVTVANYCSNCGSNAGACNCLQPLQAVVGFVDRTASAFIVLMGLALEGIGWMVVFDGTVMTTDQRLGLIGALIGVPGYIIYRCAPSTAVQASRPRPARGSAPPSGPLPPLPPLPNDGTRRSSARFW